MNDSDLWNRWMVWIRWILIGVFCVSALCLIIGALSHYHRGQYVGEAEPVRKVSTATLTRNGAAKEISLPAKIEDLEPGEKVTLTFHFTNELTDCYAEVRTAFAPLTAEVNGKTVFTFGDPQKRPSFMKDPGTTIHLIPIDATGNITVTLTYTAPNTRDSISVPNLYVSNQSGIFRRYLFSEGDVMAESFVMLVAGILLIFVSLIVIQMDRKGILFLWLGGFMTLTGLWGCSNCDMILFLFNAPDLFYIISYLSFFSLLLPLELFLEESISFHWRLPLDILKMVLVGLLLAAVVLQLTGTVMFTQTVHVYQVLLPVSVFAFTISVIYEVAFCRNKPALLWTPPMLLLSGACIQELHYYASSSVYSSSRYFILGAALFCAFMCFIGALQIRQGIQVSRREKEQEFELSMMNLEIGDQKKYQDTLLKKEKELRRQRHDYRHQLTVLQEYARSGKLDELNDYILRMQDAIPVIKEVRYTENPAVNAVVSYYAQEAEKAGAAVKLHIDLPEQLPHDMEQNLCIVFGNLLENAAEAIGRMSDESGAKRYVHLATAMHLGKLVIHMENSMEGRPRKWGTLLYLEQAGGGRYRPYQRCEYRVSSRRPGCVLCREGKVPVGCVFPAG
ncbi:MAG: GHKL domain-containing protein [Eubacteriales bacterium]